MASVSSISGSNTAYATAAENSDTASRVPQKQLGQDDFLKLLAKQFQVQDPMKPMEDSAFIAQMAQFSALEQSKSMNSEMQVLRGYQQLATANSYLGHRVTVEAGDGSSVSGDVSAVDTSGGSPKIIVNGQPFSLSAVLRVEPGRVTAPASEQTGGA